MRWLPLLLPLVACVKDRDLVPAAEVQAVPGRGFGGQVRAADVIVEVRSEAWVGYPEELTEVEPLRVTIENAGPRPVRIRYQDIALRSDLGELYGALPPFDIRGSETVMVELHPPPSAFYVAPHAVRYYPGLSPWVGPWDFDPTYWATHYTDLVRVQLPTGDMVQKALPEGVLEPGGRITGFVYFRRIERETEEVTFTMALVDPRTGETFGTATLPFRVVQNADAVSQAE